MIKKMELKATNNLVNYIDMIEKQSAERFNFKMNGGAAVLTGITNRKECAVAYIDIPYRGMSSDWHEHNEHETFVWQSGASYKMEIEGMPPFIVSDDRPFYVAAGTPHRVYSTEGASRSLIILVPGSELFPKGADNGR